MPKLQASLLAVAALAVVALAGCGENDGSGAPSAGSGNKAPSAKAIRVERSDLIYLPSQTGGNFHLGLVEVRNTSGEVALDVGGQLSVRDASGRLVKSVNPTPINILPGQKALIVADALDLPKPVKKGKLGVRLTVGEFRKGPSKSPVSFSHAKYSKDEFDCKLAGTVANSFTKQKKDLQIRAAGLYKGQLVTGGLTYVDSVFPKQDATFEVTGDGACPRKVDHFVVYANLGEDKIFSP